MDTATVTTPTDTQTRIEREFDASRELLWRAYTDPNRVAQWWGRGNHLLVERMDVKPGGHWLYVERTPQGTERFKGTYREISPGERIVSSFEWDGMAGHVSTDTVVFEELPNGRSRLVIATEFATKQDRDGMLSLGMEKGLNESFFALERLLEIERKGRAAA